MRTPAFFPHSCSSGRLQRQSSEFHARTPALAGLSASTMLVPAWAMHPMHHLCPTGLSMRNQFTFAMWTSRASRIMRLLTKIGLFFRSGRACEFFKSVTASAALVTRRVSKDRCFDPALLANATGCQKTYCLYGQPPI